MFVLRSKGKIADAPDRYARFGIAGKDAAVLAASIPDAIALGNERFLAIVPTEAAAATLDRLAASATRVGRDAWEWTSIHAGIPTIVAATQEAFVPQMANFDLVGGVSFRKGCYPGQEIVARTQYRGILKRRMALAHAETPAAAGQAVYSPLFADQAAGMVVNAAPASEGGYDLLVVAQLESLQDGRLHLGSVQGPALRIVSHPAAQAA